MLYSRRTEGDFTLSMVFGAATPLRDIRRQGKRLVELLDSVPENITSAYLPAEPEQADAEPQTRSRQAFVWLLRDPDAMLNDAAAWAIVSGLTTQLNEQGWLVEQFTARDEYVYLLADVPGETAAHLIINDLKRRSAAILRQQGGTTAGPDVWADSYLVLTPGRELDPDEIHHFIDFERTL
jgi:REP element-mobilizing transposase RayT